MSTYTQAQLIEAVYASFEYPHQISALDLSEAICIRFKWRSTAFRVSETGHVEEVEGSMLAGSDIAILARALLFRELVRRYTQ
jgi:hypothetical protein